MTRRTSTVRITVCSRRMDSGEQVALGTTVVVAHLT
jgi:hypothetical protein